MHSVLRYFGQAVVYAAIAVLFGVFANGPGYTRLPADKAAVVLSFSHGAARKGGCRKLTAEEIAALPANMRRPLDCPRERLPVVVELLVDGEVLFQAELAPSGLSGDGPSQVYQRFLVDAGSHEITAKLRDSDRPEGYDYERSATLNLVPAQNFVIDFRADAGGFVFM